MKRNTILVVAVIVAAVFFLDPFGWFRRSAGPVYPPQLPVETLSPLVDYAERHYRDPVSYIVSSFGSHDIVFFGELPLISQGPKLIASCIPSLYAAGVRNLGIEFAMAQDQKRIDSLLGAPQFDEAEARRITFNWMVVWGFQEYIDIYRAAWTFNHGLAAGAKPFRIVGLNVKQNWEYLKTEADLKNADVIAKVQSNGIPDAYMADMILKSFVEKGEKALIYCGMTRSFTVFRDAQYAKNAAEQKLSETRRCGNIVYDKIGTRAFTILFHTIWLDSRTQTGAGFPAEGVIDALIATIPESYRTAGFDTEGTPFGAIAVTYIAYATDTKPRTLADICDGYVISGPISAYTTVTLIKDFVNETNSDFAINNFPGPKSGNLTAASIQDQIVRSVSDMAQLLSGFK
jgi:hypothetical protein